METHIRNLFYLLLFYIPYMEEYMVKDISLIKLLLRNQILVSIYYYILFFSFISILYFFLEVHQSFFHSSDCFINIFFICKVVEII